MKIAHAAGSDKGWYFGPWNSDLNVSIGYANTGIDEPHVHTQITEIYLIAQGTAKIRVDQKTFELQMGDMIAIAPGESHTFLSSSTDYFHFVVHTPGMKGEAAKAEKLSIKRSKLGL